MAKRSFLQLVYRMPSKPTAGRVAVWRSLKKAGAVYLQDSSVQAATDPIDERVFADLVGSVHLPK